MRTFEKEDLKTVKIGSMIMGRASYEPGWKWSEHVGAATGASLCEVEHVGMVVSGCAACRMKDGRYYEMRAGDLFYIGPGDDSWVVGDYHVSLHFLGAEHYENDAANSGRWERDKILLPVLCYVADMLRFRPFVKGTA